jgi:outer membrane protein OmpA-like peptidoglycan-associated protein
MGVRASLLASKSIVVISACVGLLATASFAHTPQGQQTGQVQNEPITEPRSAEHKPTGPPIPKGIQAITQTDEKCSTMLVVNAEALFKPTRWTLNSDAKQTLDALEPLIAKAGKHPVRITAFSGSDNSEKNNHIVAERRALNMRTWLADRGLVPNDSVIEGIGEFAKGENGPKEPIEITIATCKPLPGSKTPTD